MVLLQGNVQWATTIVIERGYRLTSSTSITWDLRPCIETVEVRRLRDDHHVGSWSRHFPWRGQQAWTLGIVSGRGRTCSSVPGPCTIDDVLDAIDAEQSTRKASSSAREGSA